MSKPKEPRGNEHDVWAVIGLMQTPFFVRARTKAEAAMKAKLKALLPDSRRLPSVVTIIRGRDIKGAGETIENARRSIRKRSRTFA